MADREVDYGQEVRETIAKSSLAGVAATVLAVALASPAGFGGMIGASFASGAGSPNTADANDPYAVLPAYPTPLSQQEVSDIRGQLARTAVALEITRAATEAKIEFVRGVALRGEMMAVASTAPASIVAPQVSALRGTSVVADAEPAVVAQAAAEPAADYAPIVAPTVSYAAPLHDPHLELAALLFDEEL